MKYSIGAVIILAIQLKTEGRRFLPQKRDILPYIACAIFGEIGYFYCEYTAMDYLPVSLITITLAFVPVVAMATESLLYKVRMTRPMVLGALICVVGVAMVIGADFEALKSGRMIGYLLAFGAVLSWNFYNFITASLHGRYSSTALTLNQQIFTILLLFPYFVRHIPEPGSFTPAVIGGVFYLGTVGAALGFYILVKALHVIGVTPASIFSNFIPVTSTFFGWLFLGEMIAPIQIFGGAVIILSACVVIREKEKTVKRACMSANDISPERTETEES